MQATPMEEKESNMNTVTPQQNTRQYNAKWQQRFDFFNTYGAPNDPRYKAALKALPDRWSKVKINANFFAFFFGPIYLFMLGLWKKNLALLGIMIAVYVGATWICAMLNTEVPRGVDNGLGLGFSIAYALITNYAYYLKEVKGEQGWNPFKGMRF